MAEDILEEMDENFDDDSMEDILDDALEGSSDEIEDVENKTSKKKVFVKIKEFFKRILGFKKIIIIIIVSLVLLTGLVIGAWLIFLKESPSEDQAKEDQIVQKPIAEQQGEVVFEDIVDLEPFEHIQLKASSTMALISMNLSLELTDHRFRKQVYTMEDRIRKIITDQVEEMTWLELRNPEGKIMLKYNLLKRINSIFPKATVRNIYFTNFIMQ